jgi:hypothetical protein
MRPLPLLLAALAFLIASAGCVEETPPNPPDDDPPPRSGSATEVLRGGDRGLAPSAAATDTTAAAVAALDAERIEAAYGRGDAARAATDYARAFRSARTDAAFARAYERALRVEPPDFGDDYEAIIDFASSRPVLPGLVPSCAGECTIPVYALDLAAWQRAAQRAGAADAQRFFDALEAVYGPTPRVSDGDHVDFMSTFQQTWDYGGYSTLGSGAYEDALAALARADREGTPFADEIAALRRAVAQEAATTACIGGSAQDARAEASRLARLVSLPSTLRADLGDQADRLAQPAASGIETGCADFKAGGCDCASG